MAANNLSEEVRREEDLLNFVRDFLNSEEFTRLVRTEVKAPAEYVRKRFYCRCTECWIKPEKPPPTPAELVKKARELSVLQKKWARLQRERLQEETRGRLDRDVDVIRSKIAEARRVFLCHKKERELRERELREEVLDDLRRTLQVDISRLRADCKPVQKVLAYRKIRHTQRKSKGQRILHIIRKLLTELKPPRKWQPKRLKKRKRIHSVLPSAVPPRDSVVLRQSEEVQVYVEPPERPPSPCHLSEQAPPRRVEVRGLLLPLIPNTNERPKVKAGHKQSMGDILDQIDEFERKELELLLFEAKKQSDKVYPADRGFFTKPKRLVYQSFQNGHDYPRKIRVYNGGCVTKKCSFRFIKMEPTNLIEVEAVGVQRLLPGMFVDLIFTFHPEEVATVLRAEAIFLTHHAQGVAQFSLPIICVPAYVLVGIEPAVLRFPSRPIWEAKSAPASRRLKIVNYGSKDCKVLIRHSPVVEESVCELEECQEVPGNGEGESEELDEGEFIVVDDVQRLVERCLSNVFAPFVFEAYCLNLPRRSNVKVTVRFQNIDYVGFYHERYLIEVFEHEEETLKHVGSQELELSAEISGPFIEVAPLTLDFGTCVFNSVYQLNFNIRNTAHLPHGLEVKFPSSLAKHLLTNANNIIIQAESVNTYYVKLIPRSEMMETKFYTPETRILEFPVYVCLSSKVPPCKMVVTSILTEANGLTISCDDMRFGSSVIDMGVCTTAETVYTTLNLTNNSHVFQVYGFVDLPETIQVSPDCGFGELRPFETKTLTMAFSPEPGDSFGYGLTVETLKGLGAIGELKSRFSYRRIKRAVQAVRSELERESVEPLVEMMIEFLVLAGRVENFVADAPLVFDASLEDLHYPSVESEVNLRGNAISVRAQVVAPLCDLSHQWVTFPDTPCGSYSLMGIELRAQSGIEGASCVCGYERKRSACKSHMEFEARFKIVGDTSGISVEPSCGLLKAGERLKLTLVARPELPKELVTETATELKARQLLQKKLDEWYLQQKKKAPTVEPPEFEIDRSAIVIETSDLYPAEVEASKLVDPFRITAKFCCTISYSSSQFVRSPEKLYFVADCQATRPSFVHNLSSQQIDFGTVLIGTSSRKIISLHNISDQWIRPTATHVSPTGCFSLPNLDVSLPPERILKLPLTFRPDRTKKMIEYFEIRAGDTVWPLVVGGEGANASFTIAPEFRVCRLEAAHGGFSDCSIEVNNTSPAPLALTIVQLCELEGAITSGVASPKKKEVTKKFSQDLTEGEESSIQEFFKLAQGESRFRLMGTDDQVLSIQPLEKKVMKIRFETPRSAQGPKVGKGAPRPPPLSYVAKYNILLGTSTFVQDVIIIAKFK
ncbi:cilia- and flagella-associated protein 74-like [Photinus pyralis]|uniref:cilia- and flagella-associated protein 74-like n=1 Tax=Photinus pyralis TaxID=7054 RepID=UPI0012672D6A|nr:cilia- and flagella-associated protein 74-like [Photinus pyralis]